MVITKIRHQIKNTDRVNVFVDGKYSFSLDLNQLLKSKLKTGLHINESELKKLKKLSSDGKIKIRALEWLTLRPHSKKELVDYLKRKKIESKQIEVWVKHFQKMGYQDDLNFAKWWLEQRLSKHKSKRYIIQELRLKGVNQEIIAEVLDSQLNEKDTVKQLVLKKRKLAKYQDEKKLIEYLLRQGFNYSLIKEVLAEE